jgi:4-hydroxymandelate oxidase
MHAMPPSSPSNPVPRQIPSGIHAARDYELAARQCIPAATYAYLAGGSGEDLTLDANRRAYADWAIYPRLLRDLRLGHSRLRLQGQELAHPILLAPLAYQQLVHPGAELETARAAAAAGAGLLCSSLSSYSLEQIAEVAGAQRWFQLYLQPRREHSLDLLRRAEAAGYQAIVLTLDAAVQLPSRRALDAGFRLPADCVAGNLRGYPPAPATCLAAGQSRVFQGLMAEAPRWADLDWLLAESRLPVWVKGVLHPEDARALQTRGVAGLVVSNHGGRTLDGAPASLRALPAVRAAVGQGYPLLFDGGIRSGSEVFKALALGADAVLIGRLQVYALAVAGALGVAHLIKLLHEELEVCMAMAGCASLAEIGPACLCPVAAGATGDSTEAAC